MKSSEFKVDADLSVKKAQSARVGALISRIGFWGPLYYNYNKEPPQ